MAESRDLGLGILGLGAAIQSGFEAYQAKKQREQELTEQKREFDVEHPTLTTDQAQALGIIKPEYQIPSRPYQVRPDQTDPSTQTVKASDLFPKGISLDAASQSAAITNIGGKDFIPVTESVRDVYKTAGVTIPKESRVTKSEYQQVAGLAKQKEKPSTTPDKESVDSLVEGVHKWVQTSGKEGMPPETLPGFGVNSLKGQVLAAWGKKYPKDSGGVSVAEAGFKGSVSASQSAARAPNSPQMFKIRAMANSLIPQLDLLSKASDAVSRSDVRAINSLQGQVGVAFSNKDWSNLKKRAMIVADEFQAQIGAGSDQKLDLATKLIHSADSADVLNNAINIMKSAVKARAIASTGAIPSEGQIEEKNQNSQKDETDPLGIMK